MNVYKNLEDHFTTLSHLHHIERILQWDEAAMMPTGGGQARAEAMATLKALQHKHLTQPQLLDLLDQAAQQALENDWQRANLSWMKKHIKKQHALPVALVKEKTATALQTEQAWRHYRAENNWKDFQPHLEKLFSLVKTAAEHRSQDASQDPYDILIDDYCPGMQQSTIDPIFKTLADTLPPLVKKIQDKQNTQHHTPIKTSFDISKQEALGKTVMKALGFDFQQGRLDTSHHPFCGGVPTDVRITTRYSESDWSSALFGTCHETGHALYEQGLPKKWRDQPVGQPLGYAVHESQSLLIEMDICHSMAFMNYLSEQLNNHFHKDPSFDPEALFKTHTRVAPSLIRVDADEVTYPLHVILRYEIEKGLFSGAMHIRDLPDIWNEKMKHYLGLSTKNNYRDGVMQDVHWPAGAFGYFPAYTLGRLMASQFYHSIKKSIPDLDNQIKKGYFQPLKSWLNKHIHEKASLQSNFDLLKSVTGETLNSMYFRNHINDF